MNTTEKYIRFLLLSFLIFIKAGYLFAQIDHKKLQFEAEKAFLNEEYKLALKTYEKISDKEPEIIYKKAMCYYYLNSFDLALTYFQNYLKYKKHNDDALYFTARCFHLIENFKKAAELYRFYLKTASPKSIYRAEAKLLMLQAANAEIVKRSEQYALMMPLSETMNSAKNDYSPIENPRYPGQYFYSSMRNASLAIFTENFSDTKTSVRLDSRYNSSKEQQIVAFPDSGFQILYLRNSKLVIDNYKDGHDQSLALGLKGFEKLNISDAYLINDSLLIFSSDMPGGYGRSDLYAAAKDSKGSWGEIKNLGPKVNTAFDEKTPFLSDNSTQLFFSSNRPEAIGGFDVFRVDLLKNDAPLVFAYPINTTGDELFFRPKSNSNEAWLSSVRKNGFGGLDRKSVV
jgi:hypothetical protein